MLAVVIAGTTMAIAQPKPKLNRVETWINSGKMADAKDMIDRAVDYEKTKDDPKTYYLRGLVYAVIDTTQEHQGLAENPLPTAAESFIKANEMNGDEKDLFMMDAGIPVAMTTHIEKYWAYYMGKGGNAYGAEDYATAMENFERAALIRPADTNAYINAGVSAQNINENEAAIKNFYSAIEYGLQDKSIWNLLIYLVGSVEKDLEEALRLTREIRKVYPEDNDLSRTEISLLIQMQKVEEAEENLKAQLEAEQDDPNLWFTLGILNEEIAEKVEDEAEKEDRKNRAMEAYNKAVEADPSHYSAQYNKGVMLISEANEIIKERNALGVSKADLKKAEELTPIIQEKLKVALPQWEIIKDLKGDDVPTLETLSYLYTQLKMPEKAEAIMDEIDTLKGG